MPAQITRIADAVVAALNAARLSQQIWAERRYRPREKFEELGDKIYVKVIPVGTAAEGITRGPRLQRTLTIEVVIQRRVNFQENAEADALQKLVEEIEDLFIGHPLASTEANCIASEIGPPYNLENADQLETFTAALRLTFLLLVL